ncbi:helix-turn-helix domain-containing protein [Nitrogeniibacter aestuarii]|uniref:helix-turn-helix domain-containing protein n=1 Tax=Nitrogeniibacter aestuarii TaxID=2815343 RepID=UPI001D1203DF|nr:helix-turn-helix domain-containing protein [Nitrogeniibacter aestuarii]
MHHQHLAVAGHGVAPIPPAIQIQEHFATDTNAQAFDGWHMDYTQLSPGQYRCASREVRLSGLQIFSECGNATTHQCGTSWPNSYVFGMGQSMRDEGIFNGRKYRGNITVFRGESSLDAVTPPMTLLVMAIDRDKLNQYLWEAEGIESSDWLRKNWLLVENLDLSARAAQKVRTLFEACSNNPTVLGFAQSRAAIEQAALEAVTPVVLEHIDPPPPSFAEQSRIQLMRRAREFVLEHVDEPLQIMDVCRALRVSRRALQYAFQDTLQMNPVAYLKLLRLNGARRDLLAAAGTDTTQVQDVIARWGFWHFSRFSAEYKQMFQELPSETLHGRKPARSVQ